MALKGSGEAGRPGSRAAGRILGALLLSVALYYAVWGGEYSVWDLRRLAADQRAEAAELERVRREVDSLRLLAQALESDPATIEQVARERFGMIRRGELLYRFVELPPAQQQASRGTP